MKTPSVHELSDGSLLIVGRWASDEEIEQAGAHVDSDGEAAIVIDRDLLADVGLVEAE